MDQNNRTNKLSKSAKIETILTEINMLKISGRVAFESLWIQANKNPAEVIRVCG